MAGVTAFAFSTVVITIAGEIAPQAYFSRRAMKMASMLSPVLRFYQRVLYPVAKPSAWVLDKWLGVEGIEYLKERQIVGVIEQHIESEHAEIDFIEGRGALNFLDIDDIPIADEGQTVDPMSIISLPTRVDLPILPTVTALTDTDGYPQLLLDADAYLRAIMYDAESTDGYQHCHRPIVITDPMSPLGHIIGELKKGMDALSDAAIEKDIELLWTPDQKQVITGADLLGRLLRGIGPELQPVSV